MRRLIVVGLASLLLTPVAGRAQSTGAIAGLATDESGAVLPGVAVEVTNQATGLVRATVTGADGLYTVPLLPPGRYVVRAVLDGFRTLVREGIVVSVNDTARVDLRLQVGTIGESVVVTAEAPLVETSHATLGIVIDERQIADLPLNGRNFTQLGPLIPGVVAPPAALGGQAGDATPGGFGAVTAGFNVNGMRNQSNNFLLDGASNNDTFNTGFVLRPPPDAIQEFKILTHSYNAEYGRNAGSVVDVVTKSGTNELHGSLWEFNRDDRFEARNFFAPPDQPKPVLEQHQFGATLGGPILRNRLFAFGYYEGYRNRRGTTTVVTVPTAAQRAGDFSGGPVIRDPLTRQPFPGNAIPPQRIDPAARRLLDEFVPLPNTGATRYTASPVTTDDRDAIGLRLDYRPSAAHALLGRYLRTHTDRRTPPITTPAPQISRATLQDAMLSHTYLAGGAINVARVAYNRIYANPAVTSGLRNADYGIDVPHNVPQATGLASILVRGFFTLGDPQQPFVERVNAVFQFTNDLAWTRGRHTWKAGIDVRREHMVIAFINRPNGDFDFNGVHTGNALADFLLGLPGQFRRTTANSIQDGVGWLYAAYAQDEFRLSPRLTLNYGLRYELPIPFVDKNDALNAFRPGQQSRRFPDAPTGLVYPGDPGVPRGTYETDRNNVAPRVAVAWDPTGSGRTSVRAAWGLFYDALAGQGDFFQNGVLAPPFTPLLEINAPPAPLTLREPLRAATGGAPGFPPGLIFIGWGEDFASPYAHHFNVTVQRQLGDRLGVEVGYVGSRGKHLPIFMEVNPGLYTPGQTTRGARKYPAFSLVRPTFSVAESWYDSLQASARMRPWKGLHFLAAYTLGHAVDHVSGLNIGGEQRPVLPVEIGNEASIREALAYEKGDALFDVRHRLVVSFGAELPAPGRLGTLAEGVLGGWQLNGIVQWQTGFPFSVFDPVVDIRYLTNRPDRICDPNDGAPHTPQQWFRTECFVRRSLPETGERPGNAGRNTVRGPGFARTDLSLFKNVGLWRGHRLQLRIEAFNLFDQVRFGQPGNQIGTATFGMITSADDGRIVQVGVKYLF
ncbi:MAG TPA: TonB-dependent receptor [Vicinamibacterales bacterium]|nr:TonB-dependent receptor [Vicinamibacterales bacterium]